MTKKKVLEVRSVQLFILESLPLKLSITALGTVRSSGWKYPELIPYTYIQTPSDNVYDYDFVAEPPEEGT